jgi:hypothetical protein
MIWLYLQEVAWQGWRAMEKTTFLPVVASQYLFRSVLDGPRVCLFDVAPGETISQQA